MEWKEAPLIKIYEALGSIADDRVKIEGNAAKVYSSSGNKYYDVIYDPDQNAITANDNASYWVGYLGYPSICFLLKKGLVPYDPKLVEYLKGFMWKDINQKFKNDFVKTQAYIDEQVVAKYGIDLEGFHRQLEEVWRKINDLHLKKLGQTAAPPQGY